MLRRPLHWKVASGPRAAAVGRRCRPVRDTPTVFWAGVEAWPPSPLNCAAGIPAAPTPSRRGAAPRGAAGTWRGCLLRRTIAWRARRWRHWGPLPAAGVRHAVPDATTLLVGGCRERGLEVYLHHAAQTPGKRRPGPRRRRPVGPPTHGRSAYLRRLPILGPRPAFGERARSRALVRTLLDPEGFANGAGRALGGRANTLRTRFGRGRRTGMMLLRQPEGDAPPIGGADWGERRMVMRE